ncbi:NB-ARC domain-containing protein [Streptodolium elevatio]|uniref:NB-ARC domain-containing protein n=1 Tax=Streptodolium elevatio TaxID=3157996 RepID=A0ABV3DLU8_9ACTN
MRRRVSPAGAAGASTVLGFSAGVLANLATSQWTWGIGVALVVLVLAWAGFEAWKASDPVPPANGPTGALAAAEHAPWMAPPLDAVVERPEIGQRLLDALLTAGGSGTGPVTALRGAGGFGKTTLAAWAAHRPEVRERFPGGLLWITLGQGLAGAELAERVNELSATLSGTRPTLVDPDAAGAELGRLLDMRGAAVLIVVDDVWDAAQLRPFRYGGRLCSRLITTRVAGLLPDSAEHLVVDAMNSEEARHMLSEHVPGLSREAADRMTEAVGCWPVLLHLLSGSLRQRVGRGQDADAAARDAGRRLRTQGPAVFDAARPTDRSQAVAATVTASLDLLTPPQRERYADLAVFPEDAEIPVEMLDLLWPAERADRLCEEFADLGLVADYRLDAPGPRLILHDVLRTYLLTQMSGSEQQALHARIVDAARGLVGVATAPSGESVPAWWDLPTHNDYLWRHLAHHLAEAGRNGELAALATDLRWVEARTRRSGSAAGALADAERVDTPAGRSLARVLEQAAAILGPIEPTEALAATLLGQVTGVADLADSVDRYRDTLSTPRLQPAVPFPDRPDPSRRFRAGHSGAVMSCRFAPDGKEVATVGKDGSVRFWDPDTQVERLVLTGHVGVIWDCVYSPDGTLLVTASADGTARTWSVADGSVQRVFAGHDGEVRSCAVSADGKLLATTGSDSTVRLWSVEDGREIHVLRGHSETVWACAFSPDGTALATGGDDGVLRVWDTQSGGELGSSDRQDHRIRSCAFLPDGRQVAGVVLEGSTLIWDISVDTPTSRLLSTESDGRWLWNCAVSPDGTLLATGDSEGALTIRSLTADDPPVTINGHIGWIRRCDFSPDGRHVATSGIDGSCRIWAVAPGGAQTGELAGQVPALTCAFSSDGTHLAMAEGDRTVRVRHLSDGSTDTISASSGERFLQCAISHDGALVATSSAEGTIRVWSVDDGTERAAFVGHVGATRGCTFSPDGTLLASAGSDETVRLWDLGASQNHAVLSAHSGRVGDCAFSPDGELLATTGADGTVRLWNVRNRSPRAVLLGHADATNHCQFSPDGTMVVSSSDDGTARVWRVADAAEQVVLRGPSGWLEGCTFSPDSTMVAAAGWTDGCVLIWDVATGACRCAIRLAGDLYYIRWHPSGSWLAAAGGGGLYEIAVVD